ncbi:LysR family transcriptional regulator [Mesorhizobium waimense]|uniref:LysR family transcriptional regulator n=1 Tax=Mesorhizobium waimense TaxID=1300307 RepID=A0A3A5KHL4_9HYPH|nr:LysR family transcriptional regulator [Mesorhizobium waimense]RJT31998.1 LysR family transcriptional regulator [Mesorhizobium waimense]
MRDNLDGVSVFVEAVEAGGFARAAERLALTRSAVGKTIARLEARLGVRLFHRTTRSQGLTEDGQIYYERCLRALEELRAGEALLESGRREVRGRLKVSLPLLFGRHCVEPVLLELARQHPSLELDLRFSDSVVDLVAERFDLAVRNGTPGEGSGLSTRKIVSQKKIVCASPSYLATRGTPTDIASLLDHDALVYWRNDQPFPWTFHDESGRAIVAKLKWRLQFDNQEAIADAAVQGMGVAWLPSWLVSDQLEAGHLVTLLDQFQSLALDTYAVWPSAQYIPMRLRAAIDTLAANLKAVTDI